MISQGGLPAFEKHFHSTGTDATTETNCDQNREEILNSSEFSSRMNVDTTRWREQTFERDAPQVVPYFVGNIANTLSQASAIWTQSSIDENGLHYYNPGIRWSDVSCTAPVFSTETSFPGVASSFFLKVQPGELSSCAMTSQQALTDNPVTADHNSQHENNTSNLLDNPSNASRQPFCNPTSNRLQHYSLPFNQVPCQQDNFFLELSSELTSPLSHFGVPYSNQRERSNVISTSCFDPYSTLPAANDYYSQPQLSGDIPNQTQTLPYFYPLNFVPQSFFNQYCLEIQDNSQMYNNMQPQTPNYVCNDSGNQRELSGGNTCLSRQPLNILNGNPIPRNTNQELTAESSMYTRISLESIKPQSAFSQSDNNSGEPRKTSSCLLEGNIETFVPKFYEKVKLETDLGKQEDRPLCLLKEASLSEQVKAQVDEFMTSPKKRRSTGKRKLSCPICDRKLARTSTLNIHMRQHSGDRPFKCASCPKAFAQPSLLHSHCRTHTGERPYSCSICHKTFAYSSALKTHIRTHTGERPHKCPVLNCECAFADSSTLLKHARVHSGERPYPCDICGKRFTQSGNMNKHRRTIHKVGGFSMEKISYLEKTMILSELLRNNDNKVEFDDKIK